MLCDENRLFTKINIKATIKIAGRRDKRSKERKVWTPNRMDAWCKPGRSNPTESATENKPPEMVRVKQCGKSARLE